MRRKTTFMRGRILPVLTAALIGYLIGGWHPVGLSAPAQSSAADTVALRFPQAWDGASSAAAPDDALASSGVLNEPGVANAAANVTDGSQLALLDPQPMAPQISPQPVAQALQDPPRVQLASAEMTEPPAPVDPVIVRRPEP